ncbi:MAG: aminoacyl-tRNA hydrolase [Anaerolineaceae bacterium]|jgi:PTH1 family peptidyl-tRNA hydrolase
MFDKEKVNDGVNDNQLPCLIVGLGNPGREYRQSRHNVGFMAIDQLAAKLDIRMSRVQSHAIVGMGSHQDRKVILAKPQTFMNDSGKSVSGLMHYYKLPINNLMVIHDDIDLPFGVLRIRPAGGSAGQKGVASIIERIGTQDYPRMRIGVGRPPGRKAAASYVLEDFGAEEQQILQSVFDQAVEAVLVFLEAGIDQAMNRFNGPALKE